MTRSKVQPTSLSSLLAEHQSRLYAFVFTLVGDAHQAHDVLQETNRVLLETVEQFDSERAFLPWAFTVAKNQVRTARQSKARSRLAFDEDVVARLADRASERAEQHDSRLIALAKCLETLQPQQRELVTRRYQGGESVQSIASELGRTAQSLAVTLHRVRQALASCIQGSLEKGAQA